MDTDIFLLDEPTANLDFTATQQLKEILTLDRVLGKTLLLSEHRLYYLADIADEFWVMADGEIRHKYTSWMQRHFHRSNCVRSVCAHLIRRIFPFRKKYLRHMMRRRHLPFRMCAIHTVEKIEPFSPA